MTEDERIEAAAMAVRIVTDPMNNPNPETACHDIARAAIAAYTAGSEPWGWVIPRGGSKKPVIMPSSRFDENSAAAEADIHDHGYFPLYTAPQPTVSVRGHIGTVVIEWLDTNGFLSSGDDDPMDAEITGILDGLKASVAPQPAVPPGYVLVPVEHRDLLDAVNDLIASASDTYKKRNGHIASFQDDSGEKCWIVPFDAFEAVRSIASAMIAAAKEQP